MRGTRGLVLTRLLEADPVPQGESLEARVDAVRSAVWTRNEEQTSEEDRWYPVDIFEEFVIVRHGRSLLQVPYSFDAEGVVSFGDPVAVQAEYRPIQETASVLQLVAAEGDDPEGLEWDVEIIRPGKSLNGYTYPADVLREAVPLFEGSHVYVFDDDPAGHKKNPLAKAPRYLAGWIDQVEASANGVLSGRLHFFQEGVADGIRKKLVDAWKRGNKKLMGLSIDARGLVKKGTKLVESIVHVLSTDVVLRPAAGGRFTRLVASAPADHHITGGSMSKYKKKLLRLLEARRPEAYAGIEDQEAVTIDELVEMLGDDADEALREAFGAEAVAGGGDPAPQPANQGGQAGDEGDPVGDAVRTVRLTESRLLLRDALAGSKLPDLAQKRIRERFTDQVLTEQQIQEAISDERDYLASLVPSRVSGLGGPREGAGVVSAGAEKLDRLQAAFDRGCGLEPENADLKNIRPIGLRRLYNEITLGQDPDVTGHLQESTQRAMLQESFTSTTLAEVVNNTLHRRMVRDYRELDYGERRIINVVSANDFKTREAIRVGYFGDLSTVDPETADYAELAAYTEEYATYSVGQKGNIVTITRKHIINDDVGHVAKIVGRLGRAARRTFARFVWTFVTGNGNIYDATAWFTAGHGNLLATALSDTSLNSAEAALFAQTELSSGELLGLRVALLAIPIELEPTAYRLNQSELLSSSMDANPWYHRFGVNNENIITSPFFTDANDWAVFARPEDGDIIEVAFLNGQEEPELFLADTPTVGQMFTADKIQYKIRHEYGGAVVDYRTAVKAVVA